MAAAVRQDPMDQQDSKELRVEKETKVPLVLLDERVLLDRPVNAVVQDQLGKMAGVVQLGLMVDQDPRENKEVLVILEKMRLMVSPVLVFLVVQYCS